MTKVDFKNNCKKMLAETSKKINTLPWEDKNFYGLWLGQMHYFLIHATRMLQVAGSFYGLKDDNLHLYCLDHSIEEKNHDKLAADDLDKLGFSINHFSEFPETAQLYQSQYFYMHYLNPAALFGNIYYLEGLSLAVDPEAIQRIVDSHGKECCQLLLCHTEADEDHIVDIEEVIDGLENEAFDAAMKSFILTRDCYERMFDSCLKYYKKPGASHSPIEHYHLKSG